MVIMTTATPSGGSEKKVPGFADHFADLLLAVRGMSIESHQAWAKKMHKARAVYLLYGALDGLSLSYSMVKYLFDLLFADSKISSVDAMRDWMMSPEGAATIAASSVTLIVFSMLANYFDDDDKDLFKRYMAVVWPYCREIMKGLKNTYKGVRSTFLVFEFLGLGGQDLRHMIVPVGLLLGGLSVINRLWFRYMVGQPRKAMMKANSDLWDEILASPRLSIEEITNKREQINHQSQQLRAAALLSAAYSGIVDGLYLYVGVLGICSLTPAVLQAMSVFCAIYFLACVATRIYEEYNYQRLLRITQARIELALYGKEIEFLVGELEQLSQVVREDDETAVDRLENQKTLALKLTAAVEALKLKREELRSLSTVSYASAILAGLGNGLSAYGAFTSSMFAISSLLILTSTAFPPNMLIGCIILGMACLTGFVAQSVIAAHKHYVVQREEDFFNSEFPRVIGLLSALNENNKACTEIDLDKIKTTVSEGLKIDRLPQSLIQAGCEIPRSFCSGIGKGIKGIGFILFALQEVDEQGNSHDTPLLVNLMVASAVVHAFILALRAYARGLGRPPLLDEIGAARDSTLTGDSTAADLSLPKRVHDVARLGGFWKPKPNQNRKECHGSALDLTTAHSSHHTPTPLRRPKSLGILFSETDSRPKINADDQAPSASRDDSCLPYEVVM